MPHSGKREQEQTAMYSNMHMFIYYVYIHMYLIYILYIVVSMKLIEDAWQSDSWGMKIFRNASTTVMIHIHTHTQTNNKAYCQVLASVENWIAPSKEAQFFPGNTHKISPEDIIVS